MHGLRALALIGNTRRTVGILVCSPSCTRGDLFESTALEPRHLTVMRLTPSARWTVLSARECRHFDATHASRAVADDGNGGEIIIINFYERAHARVRARQRVEGANRHVRERFFSVSSAFARAFAHAFVRARGDDGGRGGGRRAK